MIKTLDDAKELLGIDLPPYQAELVAKYLEDGTRPDPVGCWHCDEAEARKITGWIDYYNNYGGEGAGEYPV